MTIKRISALGFLIIICLIGVSGFQSEHQDIRDEEIFIQRCVTDYYIKGLQIRDFALIRKICIPEAVLMSTGRDNKLHITTLDSWSKRFDPDNPPFKNLDYSIIKIDREGTAAQVKILFIVDGKNRVVDYLNLLKIEGAWRIVNIIDY